MATSTELTKTAYFNRELSWLAFNRRVLDQSFDASYPLLERLMFMTFVCSNLDEFYEIRVAGLIQQVESNIQERDLAGLSPGEQIRRIHNITTELVKDQYDCWAKSLVPALNEEGLHFRGKDELSESELKWLEGYFDREVFPVLTPLAIDPAHPFPQFGNKTLNILLALNDESSDESILAFIPVPRILPRVVALPVENEENQTYVFLSDLLKFFAGRLFPGYEVVSAHAFRITRNSDLYIDEEEGENLLKVIEEELYKMRRGQPVRLEIDHDINEALLHRLLENIHLSREHVFLIDGPINLLRLRSVYAVIDRPDLKFKSFKPHLPKEFSDGSCIYALIREEDKLLHHPYDSFAPVVEFVAQAATDPDVLAIKITLYRTGPKSPIVRALLKAARNNKQVTVLIELKARFDEAANIGWAKLLEEAGVHVVYGIVGLKTHCKCCLVVRRDEDGLRRYAHLGTGNYHTKTAKLYTDLSFFTCNETLTADVAEVFNTLTGLAKAPEFKALLVAPYSLHDTMVENIRREREHALAGKPSRIILKCNSLIDKEAIDELYEASQAGVEIDIIVRGICGLVPGVAGMSENIRVRSILGRYLEHSRIYYFENHGEEPLIYAGSADWMPRNFFRRIEVIFPIKSPDIRRQVLEVLKFCDADTSKATCLQPNGAYVRALPEEGEVAFSMQDFLIENAEGRNHDLRKPE